MRRGWGLPPATKAASSSRVLALIWLLLFGRKAGSGKVRSDHQLSIVGWWRRSSKACPTSTLPPASWLNCLAPGVSVYLDVCGRWSGLSVHPLGQQGGYVWHPSPWNNLGAVFPMPSPSISLSQSRLGPTIPESSEDDASETTWIGRTCPTRHLVAQDNQQFLFAFYGYVCVQILSFPVLSHPLYLSMNCDVINRTPKNTRSRFRQRQAYTGGRKLPVGFGNTGGGRFSAKYTQCGQDKLRQLSQISCALVAIKLSEIQGQCQVCDDVLFSHPSTK